MSTHTIWFCKACNYWLDADGSVEKECPNGCGKMELIDSKTLIKSNTINSDDEKEM